MVQHHDRVGIADGGKPVRNDEDRAALHQGVHALLNDALGAGVDGGRGFVQDHHGRVLYRGPGNGDQLALALRKAAAVAGQHRVIALGQHPNEAVRVDQLCCLDAFLVRGVRLAEAKVFHHRASEEIHVLKHHAQRVAQIVLLDLVDIDAVIADLAVGNVVETGQKVRNGRLASAGSAYKGDLLAWLGVDADVVQHDLLRGVAEVHVVQHNVALQLGVGGGAVAVRMLPRPQAGALVAFTELAILVPAGVHQRDVALVGFAWFVHQAENALCARQRHDDRGKLLAYLRNGHHEAAGQGQEGGDHAQRNGSARAGQADVGHAAQAQTRADDRQNDVENVAHVVVDGAQNVGEAVGFGGVVAKLLVAAVKFLHRLALVAEDLDHLLAVHHFLDVAVDGGQRLLLLDEELAALAGYPARDPQDEHGEQHHRQGEPQALAEHGHEYRHDGNHGREDLRQGLRDHLAQGVGIVGVVAHDLAVAVGVKVADGQGLHMGEHIVPHVFQNALRHHYHQPVVQETADHAGHVNAGHVHQLGQQAGKVRARLNDHGSNVIVDQGLDEGGSRHAGNGVAQNAQKHQQQAQAVTAHIAHQPGNGRLHVLRLCAALGSARSPHHSASLPFI